MNFRPLCTAMVWPIMSGRIVDRRDQVLTTFFSFRAFIPSTFSRRWMSMNGPFLSERAIVSPCAVIFRARFQARPALVPYRFLFFDPPQFDPLGAPQFAESAHGSRHAVRHRTERAHKSRALRVRSLLHGDRPSGLAQAVQHLHGNRRGEPGDRFHRLGRRRTRSARGFARSRHPPCRWSCSPASCCAHHRCLNFPSNTRRARLSIFSATATTRQKPIKIGYGFLRCTIWPSERRLRRVFLPSVENPHGVCGWLPFTRPSPPPCG